VRVRYATNEAELCNAVASDTTVMVVGVIELNARLGIVGLENFHLVGPGTIARNNVTLTNCCNCSVTHVRFRLGDGASAQDCLTLIRCVDCSVMSCSFAWSVDELASFSDCKGCTFYNCLMAYPLNNSVHPKGPHGLGPILQGTGLHYRYNVTAWCDFRPVVVGQCEFYGCWFHGYGKSYPVIAEAGSYVEAKSCLFTTKRALHGKAGSRIKRKNIVVPQALMLNEGGEEVDAGRLENYEVGVFPRDKLDALIIERLRERAEGLIDKPEDLPGGWDLLQLV